MISWARTWRIRQFQFFGVPPITPTREIFRLERITAPSSVLKAAHKAAKDNDYGAWLLIASEGQLSFKTIYMERKSTRYPDESVQRLTGLVATSNDLGAAVQLTTRVDEWRIESHKGKSTNGQFSPPWTRFNNCALIDSIEFSVKPFALDIKANRHPQRLGLTAPHLPGMPLISQPSATEHQSQ